MAENFTPSADWFSRRRYVNTEVVALSVTTAKNATPLTVGKLYRVSADVAWHMNHGPQASVTATVSHVTLAAHEPIFVWASDTNFDGVAGILDASTGKMFIVEVK